LAFDAHFGSGADASFLFGDMEALNERRRGCADGTNDGGAKELAAVFEFDPFMGGGDGAGIQEDSDAGFFHFFAGEIAKRWADFGQYLVLRVDHGYDSILFLEIAVEAGAAANQFVEFAGDFDPAEPGAHNDEMEEPAASLGISSCFGVFHLTDDVLPEVDRVAHDLESESVVRHARDDPEVAVRATGENNMVVVEARPDAVALVVFNFGGREVDSLDTFGAAANAGEHLAKRGCGCVYIDGGTCDIGEQRMKNHVVLAVEEKNFTVGRAQHGAKGFCELYGRKSSPDDDNSDWLHFGAPMSGSNDMKAERRIFTHYAYSLRFLPGRLNSFMQTRS
jgi:hypothetical protein